MSLRCRETVTLSCNYISGKFWSWGWGPVWDFVHSWWLFKQYCLAQCDWVSGDFFFQMWCLLTILSFQNSRVWQFRLWNLMKSLLKRGPTHPTDRVAFLSCFSVSLHSYWCLSQVNAGTWKSNLSDSSELMWIFRGPPSRTDGPPCSPQWTGICSPWLSSQ